jgi:hypothetical protein
VDATIQRKRPPLEIDDVFGTSIGRFYDDIGRALARVVA